MAVFDQSRAATRSPIRRMLGWPGRMIRWVGGSAESHALNISTALVQIRVNKARAMLTTLGIVIAVTSTITVVSFVQGFGNYFTDMLRGFGTNLIFVVPEFPSGMRGRMLGRVVMDIDDVRAVSARCDKVRRITPMIFTEATIEYGREKIEGIQMRGATEQFQSVRNSFVDTGRFFGPIDVEHANHVCVLGRTVMDRLQADDKIVGDYVFINEERYLVLGIFEEKGEMMGSDQDNKIVIPYTAAIKNAPIFRLLLPFAVEATGEEDVPEASLQIARVLRERHGIKPGQPNDFRILRQDEFLRDFERIKTVATAVLSGIVGISLIVGGIGIMNVLLVSVTERTREIGLRKAVGGRRRDIMAQFLTEAVTLALVGGLMGTALGLAICNGASLHPDMVDVPVPAWVVTIALGFSAVVGVVFGMIPAFKAAILHPIDALRHE